MISVGVMIYLVLPKELKRCHMRQKCIFSVELKTFFYSKLKAWFTLRNKHKHKHKHKYKHKQCKPGAT